MRKSLLLILYVLSGVFASTAEVVYTDANVRFDLISDGVVRLEYAPDGNFVDNNSFLAVERNYPQVDYKIKDKGAWVTITTADMELRYRKDSGSFSRDNLSIKSRIKGFPFTWHPGDVNTGNLKGTTTGLDLLVGDSKDGVRQELEDGIISRQGWTLLDDTDNYIFDYSEFAWPQHRTSATGAQDWYFMVYGHDYKQALKDYTLFAGKVPLPPRYAFGFWWSRFWAYSDKEMRQLVDEFANYGIPMDVLVLDMDWHHTRKGKGGWSGYSWNRELFPEPAKFLGDMKERGLKLTLNLHFADGVPSYEDEYEGMCNWMGHTPAPGDTIHFYTSSKQYMTGLMNKVLRPVEEDGCDFWWIDFLDYPYDKIDTTLNNIWMLNYVFFTDMERNRSSRPILYNRWGGAGNHRYQIGFSGDHGIGWKSLDYQPYFTSTAANALHGYWSHDIGGHFKAEEDVEPEMFARWMQFGALSPVLRVHSSKDATVRKEPWNFGKDFVNLFRDIVKFRYSISPYIYTMARRTYDDGISLCRPMYYDYPEAEEAYANKNEYMFGDDMLVQPITTPMQGDYSQVDVWLPEGSQWYEYSTGTLLDGGQTIERRFDINEFPLYIKGGAIVPMGDNITNLSGNDMAYQINVYPGSDGEFTLYEDNGNDKDYDSRHAFTRIMSAWSGDTLRVVMHPREGEYKDMPSQRKMSLRVNAIRPAAQAFVNGKATDAAYDGYNLAVELPLGDNPDDETVATIIFDADPVIADGTIGRFRRMGKAMTYLKDNARWNAPFDGELARLETAPAALTYHPENFDEIIAGFTASYRNMPSILRDNEFGEEAIARVRSLLGED